MKARSGPILAGAMALGLWLGTGEAAAYEEIQVKDGGTLTGTVTLVGEVPRPKGYNLTTLPDPIYCGRISDGRGWRLLQPFQVGEGGAFRQVVVLLEDIEKGKAFGEYKAPKIEAVNCLFMPFTNVVRDHHDVVVVNKDPAMHDIQAYETSHLGPRVLFNVPLPISTRYPNQANLSAHFTKHYEGTPMTQTVRMTKGRKIFTMQCGFHAYMESWAVAVDNPYFSFTNERGEYVISSLPPGSYRIRAWHPSVKHEQVYEFSVEPNQTVRRDFSLESPVGRWTAHTIQTPARFTAGALGHPVLIEPLVEHQRP